MLNVLPAPGVNVPVVPSIINVPVDATVIDVAGPARVETTVPLLVNVPPLAFRVIALSDDRVEVVSMVIFVAVAVTGAPLRLIVLTPPLEPISKVATGLVS